MEREKQGMLVSWNRIKGFGIVVVSRNENYFLHTKSVVDGPEIPARGSVVYFDVAPPFNNGKLSNAVNAIILVPENPDDLAHLLSGQSDTGVKS